MILPVRHEFVSVKNIHHDGITRIEYRIPYHPGINGYSVFKELPGKSEVFSRFVRQFVDNFYTPVCGEGEIYGLIDFFNKETF